MIYIIITACINNKVGVQNSTHRQNLYMKNIQQLLQLIENIKGIKPIVVENNGSRHTYLDDLDCDICYTDNNTSSFTHKGEIELLDIKKVINKYTIQDDDVIIKLTGRYKLLNLNFIHLVQNNMNNYDAFVKFFNVCTRKYVFDDCVLGLFSIRCKYLKDFQYSLVKSPECDFAVHVRKNIHPDRLMEVTQLDLECCFAEDLQVLIV